MKQFLFLWLLVAVATGCDENPRQGGFDPKAADNILLRLAGHMKSTKGAAFRVSLSISAEEAGRPIDVEIQYATAFERPNKFCLRPLGEFPQWLRPFSVVADGSTLTVTTPPLWSALSRRPAGPRGSRHALRPASGPDPPRSPRLRLRGQAFIQFEGIDGLHQPCL